MPSYLVHFNRLHDKKGRFTYGDGDGDGRRDDRKIGEGDRSYDTPNSGRRNYEGGGGGRFGSGRTSSGKQSKSEVTKNQQDRKPEYNRHDTYSGRSKGIQLPHTTQDNIYSSRQTFKNEMNNVNSLGSNHSGRRISSDVSSKISSFGSTPPKKTPESKTGVGNGRPIGRDYSGTSRGAAAMTPINSTNDVAEELTEDMLEKRKKDEVKDYWQKKYQNAVSKGKSYIDMLFGKETTTNAKSSDKYRKTDNAGKHK